MMRAPTRVTYNDLKGSSTSPRGKTKSRSLTPSANSGRPGSGWHQRHIGAKRGSRSPPAAGDARRSHGRFALRI